MAHSNFESLFAYGVIVWFLTHIVINVGMNIGTDAGQTVMYPHVHMIPRRKGDCEDPTGGVRNVIPGKGNYKNDKKSGFGIYRWKNGTSYEG